VLENHTQNCVTNATIDTDIDNNVALEKYDENLAENRAINAISATRVTLHSNILMY
jgi:hypothetical protein